MKTEGEQAQALSVYVGGSSDSLARVRWAEDQLVRAGISVVSTWPSVVTKVGNANPRAASVDDRAEWTLKDLAEVESADLFWFLVPSPGTTRGAWVELGYAHAVGRAVVISGDTLQSIFCALGHEFGTDEEALAFIVKWGGARKLIAGLRELRDAPADRPGTFLDGIDLGGAGG